MRRLKVAILALLPDSGHVVPLLKVGAMLVARGHEVICLLPDECSAVAETYGLANTRIGPALSPIAAEARRGFGARTIFTASLDVYYRDYHAAIFARSADMVESILNELKPRPPDLILVDNHQFPDVFAGIGAELGVPIVFHDSAGGLHNRTGSFSVMVYGKQMPRWRELCILAAGSIYNVYREAARIYRFRRCGLPRAMARARTDLCTLLTKLPPRDGARAPTSARVSSTASGRMKYYFATGLGLLEHRQRHLALPPDRRVFGAILDVHRAPLPPDLKQWLDSQPQHSVVFVSFGSMVTLSAHRLRTLLSAFGSLDAPVLWAITGGKDALSPLPLPKMIRVEPFVPQSSVLFHPAVGACVTHGGIGTVLECMAAGVPMVVLPVMWDQPYNAQFVDDLAAGIRRDWWRLSDRVLVQALRSVLLSPKYRCRVSSIAAELRAEKGSEEVLAFLEAIAQASDTESWTPDSGRLRHDGAD